MKKQEKSKASHYFVPVALQRLFVFFIIPFYVLMMVSTAWSLVGQVGQGTDVRPQLAYLYSQIFIPALIFILAYVLNPRKLPWLPRSFESLLIAIAAFLGWSLIGGLFFTLFFAVLSLDAYRIMELELYSYVSYSVFLAIFLVLLFYLRIRGKWA